MRRSLVVALIAVLLALALPLAGCGKKSDPEAPGEDKFPKQYPVPAP
jgi:predicted small lipoprotein YifL